MNANLRIDVVDGVRTFWVDSGRSTMNASLVFRAGYVDETLPTLGRIRMLNAAGLSANVPETVRASGTCERFMTSFNLSGPAEAVAEALANITHQISTLDADAVAQARAILAKNPQEAGLVDLMLRQRFGARGPGLVPGSAELGVVAEDVSVYTDLAARYFTKGNAYLCVDGPPPPGLQLVLRQGEPMPVPAQPHPERTAFSVPIGSAHLLAGALLPDGAGAQILPRLIEQRLFRGLRQTAGLTYAPASGYTRVGEAALAWVGTDVQPSQAGEAALSLWEVINQLADQGPSVEELAGEVAKAIQDIDDPDHLTPSPWVAVTQALWGRAVTGTFDQLVAELRQLTPADIAPLAGAFRDDMTLLHPPVDPPGSWPWPEPADPDAGFYPEPLTGHVHTQRWGIDPLTNNSLGARIICSDDGIGIHVPGGAVLDIHWDDVAALEIWPEGIRRLSRTDGASIRFVPWNWKHPEPIAAALDEHVPAAKTVRHVAAFVGKPGKPKLWARPLRELGHPRRWATWWAALGLIAIGPIVWAAVIIAIGASFGWQTDMDGTAMAPLFLVVVTIAAGFAGLLVTAIRQAFSGAAVLARRRKAGITR